MKFSLRTCVSLVLIISVILYVVYDMDKEALVTSKEGSFFYPLLDGGGQTKESPTADTLLLDNQVWDITKVDHKYDSSVKQIFYNMVPKCGSQSLRQMISNLRHMHDYHTSQGFTQPYITSSYHLNKDGIRETARGLLKLQEPWVYFKHLNYINFTKFGFQLHPVYINIIREPIERLESYYYYRRAINNQNKITYHGEVVADFFHDSDHEEAHRRRNMTFDECIFTSDPECTDVRFIWTIIPHFCGQHYLCHTPTRNALNLAIKNVLTEFAVVGYVAKFVQFLEVLEIIFPQFFKGAVQTHMQLKDTEHYSHKTGFKSQKASAAAREILMKNDIMKLEYEFYDFVIKRFKIVYESYTGKKLS